MSRPRVLAGAVVLLAVLAGVVTLTNALRHPPTIEPVAAPEDDGDPRLDVHCPDPAAVDQQVRDLSPLTVTSNDLYDCPHVYDGRAVRYEGEAVGALLQRRDGAWTQLNDDAYAGDLGPLPAHRDFRGGNAGVGVFLPAHLAGRIEWIGGPNARGDVLTVVGTFHLSDPVSNEVAIIRVTDGRLTAPGEPITHPPLRDRRLVGVLLAAVAIAMLAADRVAARWR